MQTYVSWIHQILNAMQLLIELIINSDWIKFDCNLIRFYSIWTFPLKVNSADGKIQVQSDTVVHQVNSDE